MSEIFSNEASLNLELYLCTEVFRLNSLHYGYWSNGTEGLDIEEVRQAQTCYTETMLDMIPEDVKTVLDVGCGIGDVSAALAARGYMVTAISPDQNHARYFKRRNAEHKNDAVTFHNVKFEDLNIDAQFDLVLMSESQDYFDANDAFKQVRRYLRPGGYLLVSGNFRKNNTLEFATCYIEYDYTALAHLYGLEVIERVDITKNVLPTLEYCNRMYHKYLLPSLDAMDSYLGAKIPRRLKVFKWLFAKDIQKFAQVQDYYAERLDPFKYAEYARYVRILFQNQD